MAYTKKDWVNEEVITEAALDNMENGIAANYTKNSQQDQEIAALKQKDTAIEGRLTALEKKVVNASSSVDGLMLKTDKAKLDGIAANANNYALPAANKTTIGGVKQAAAVAEAAGEQVSKAEFKALLDALKAAGIMASA